MIGTEKSSAARDRDRVEIVADRERAQLLEQQDQREGEQHLIEMLAIIEVAEQEALKAQAERRTPAKIATGSANQSDPVLRATRNAAYAPIMNRLPCARLITRSTPKMSVRPLAIRNSSSPY